jgi:hypothetical protein
VVNGFGSDVNCREFLLKLALDFCCIQLLFTFILYFYCLRTSTGGEFPPSLEAEVNELHPYSSFPGALLNPILRIV